MLYLVKITGCYEKGVYYRMLLGVNNLHEQLQGKIIPMAKKSAI